MKRFFRFVMEWKTVACLMFTGTMVLYLVICQILGEQAAPVGTLWSLLLVSAAGTLLQVLCFTELVTRQMRYTTRLALFCLLFLPVLAAIAWAFRWFPMESGSWLAFLGIFLAVFLIMTLGFELWFRAAGRRYDGILGQYRREREKAEE